MASEVVNSTQADFDRIARLLAGQPERSDFYDGCLISRLPSHGGRVLEIGCGTGRLSRAAAQRNASVTAIDLSPAMIDLARARAEGNPRIEFLCGDFMDVDLEAASFDAILTVATLHHLDPAAALARMKALLRLGGVLVVHDLRSFSGLLDGLLSGIAAAVNGDAWRWTWRRLRQRRELAEAWRDHGAGEIYPTLREVGDLCRVHLPGAEIHRHPLWRYTVVWRKPASGA